MWLLYQVRWSLQIRHGLAGSNEIKSKLRGDAFVLLLSLLVTMQKMMIDGIGINEANKRPLLRGAWLSLTKKFSILLLLVSWLSQGVD